MKQLDMLTSATVAGHAAAQACTEKAARLGFDPEAAGAHMLGWLDRHGPHSGEDLVLAAKEAGYVPHTDKAFGTVIRNLSQGGRIERYGFALRKRGHGTAGATIWRIVRGAGR
jgi:hypothetical protein